ncbi:MAG TPA: acetamidase/formamidase family protein [Candidatus Acidoferrales bacterium]|nr:acetamidase/formamidase family protein [Candidatus Acidoferrales bacterium]
MAREHVIDPSLIHHDWDETLAPVLEIESGDVVHFDVQVSGAGQVEPGNSFHDVRFDFDTMYNLSGPIAIAGATPGDTLCIEVLELVRSTWGWAAILPGFGLLPKEFPGGYLRTFTLDSPLGVEFSPRIRIPYRPFLGTMGVNPGGGMRLSPFPPHGGGGNIDNRYLTEGARLYLPVFLPRALFSCGDPHAVQGDGEVCVTALESPLRASLRFTLQKQSLAAPAFFNPGGSPGETTPKGEYCTMGLDPDLMEGARSATRTMISWLASEHGLSREDAYLLCSLAGQLRILEVVDAGIWNVAMCMPLAVFG